MRDAAIEGELSYSGVNLDEEAASLMEFQQAYQASARILSLRVKCLTHYWMLFNLVFTV